jgi:hypothetical protein
MASDETLGVIQGANHEKAGALPAADAYHHNHRGWVNRAFGPKGPLRPFKLLRQDLGNFRRRWPTDWGFNQLVLASAVYLFFTNLLPGITFASDLYVLTDQHYGAIEVVFSTGLCGCIFAL